MQNVTIRPATLDDLPRLTEIVNYYIVNTHITFDLQPYEPGQRHTWFHEHSDGQRFRLLVADDPENGVLGYAGTGRFRNKGAYDTTVEISIACLPNATGRGLGQMLYAALFQALAGQDIHRIVAGIAQPNAASNRLHQQFGFKPVGTLTEVGRKFDKYWDVIWMERPLKLAIPEQS